MKILYFRELCRGRKVKTQVVIQHNYYIECDTRHLRVDILKVFNNHCYFHATYFKNKAMLQDFMMKLIDNLPTMEEIGSPEYRYIKKLYISNTTYSNTVLNELKPDNVYEEE